MVEFTPYISIPFSEKGTDPSTGLNCWQLCKYWKMQEQGIEIPDYEDTYQNSKDKRIGETIDRESKRHWEKVPPGQEQIGDIILMRISNLPMHVGIVAGRIDGKKKMLHVERGSNSVLECYTETKWKDRILGFYRLKS